MVAQKATIYNVTVVVYDRTMYDQLHRSRCDKLPRHLHGDPKNWDHFDAHIIFETPTPLCMTAVETLYGHIKSAEQRTIVQ